LSVPITPQCNAIAERGNRTLIETTRTMLMGSKLNLKFWGEAVSTAAYIRNRVKSRVHKKTPYQIWYNKAPNIQHMRRFGCTAYVPKKEPIKRKFESKTIKGIFMGYNSNGTYRVHVAETGNIKNDCDAKFDEEKNGSDLLRDKEDKNNNDDTNNNLIVVGLDVEDEEDKNEELEIEEREENVVDLTEEKRVSVGDSSEYNDARMEIVSDENDIPETNDHNQESDAPPDKPITRRKAGRSRGMTKEVIQVRECLRRQERGKLDSERDVSRSTRMRNKRVMKCHDIEIPKSVRGA
ncbi:Copia protein, partial [Eufriesea mexicana]